MTRVECRTAIRAGTDQDATDETNAQVTAATLNAWIDAEHKLLRRELARVAPSLYTATDVSQTVSGASLDTLALPADFDTLVRVERQAGTAWYPLDVSDGLSPHTGGLTVREEGASLKVAPAALATGGAFRIVYIQAPATLTADSGTGGVLLVPGGCEDIIVDRVSARVQSRFQRDPSPYLSRAADTWKHQKTSLRRRYGNMPVPGLRRSRGW